MNGDTVLMVLKTFYGVIWYSGTVLLTVVWLGTALAYVRMAKGMNMWILFMFSMLGYAGLFIMLSVIASGNELFGQEINAWFNRTFTAIGFINGAAFTYIYLAHKWRTRVDRSPMSD